MQIDCVTVKGSEQPIGLFTYDVDLSHISCAPHCTAAAAAAAEAAGSVTTPATEADESAGDAAQKAHIWTEYNDEWTESADLVDSWGADAGVWVWASVCMCLHVRAINMHRRPNLSRPII